MCTLALISFGTTHYGSPGIGTSMGLTAFSLLIVVSAFDARSVTATALTVDTFDIRNLNRTGARGARARRAHHAAGRLPPPVRDGRPDPDQWALALAPAVALVGVWELGKLIARRQERDSPQRMTASRMIRATRSGSSICGSPLTSGTTYAPASLHRLASSLSTKPCPQPQITVGATRRTSSDDTSRARRPNTNASWRCFALTSRPAHWSRRARCGRGSMDRDRSCGSGTTERKGPRSTQRRTRRRPACAARAHRSH